MVEFRIEGLKIKEIAAMTSNISVLFLRAWTSRSQPILTRFAQSSMHINDFQVHYSFNRSIKFLKSLKDSSN